MAADNAQSAEFPSVLAPLFQPKRYKVMYGGRGGGKSWAVARALLIMGAQRTLRVLCAREFQKSINESVHKLLSDQIKALGLEDHYEIQKAAILGRNGTEFTFYGLRHNVANIKSTEGADIVWVEEAQTVSAHSWNTLIPTIRKETRDEDGNLISQSEIWITFNPELEDDETYQRFVVNPPSNAWVQKVNHSENPWFPEVLREEMLDLKKRRYDEYLNVWEGHCRSTLEGAIYVNEIRNAYDDGRICSVPWEPMVKVHTFWDLGWSDQTAIIMAQSVGQELRVIDYVEASQRPLHWFLAELQRRPYLYEDDWLPHDARAKTLAAEMSIEAQLRKAGRHVRIVPNLRVVDGINAARIIFGKTWFDERKAGQLLQCLKRYRYDVSPEGRISSAPKHDQWSHGADAFRMMAVASQRMSKAQGNRQLRFTSEFA